MGILVVAEHDNATLKGATLNTIAAAKAIGGDIDVLVKVIATFLLLLLLLVKTSCHVLLHFLTLT